MRLEDESEPIRGAVPAEYADVVVAITELGGPTTLMVLLAVLFWCHDRRRSALVISYAVAGLGFMLTLETVLGLPRPPESALLTPLEIDGYGFPSGHAFAATVVYGGLISVFDRLRDWRAMTAAAAIIVAISLSRVVLGVHYLGDVIVGIVLGIVFVAAMNRLTRSIPTLGFAIAAVFAVPAVFLTGGTTDSVLALGGAIGGVLTAGRIDRLPALRSRLEGLVLVAVGGGIVVGLRTMETVVEVAPLLVALYAVLVAWVFSAPLVVGRLASAGAALRSQF
ncbi:phosphatase PAP2 family protein [Natronolimnohabitans sp. A-GB9]|uniref:phosphatase PAP2 family protein n=1 Tax=Natronolimnohabitans sp. A-GB9 TaxID=3069757 RepID=UPI0027B5B1A5|nr:phosphatase PAP2 family protein [Natronolimnohabitans sp. A-GB9]MDQ2049478.1 phosphatase PAP2 family protein [Natronolimnohabitans sp. A-GB9]